MRSPHTAWQAVLNTGERSHRQPEMMNTYACGWIDMQRGEPVSSCYLKHAMR